MVLPAAFCQPLFACSFLPAAFCLQLSASSFLPAAFACSFLPPVFFLRLLPAVLCRECGINVICDGLCLCKASLLFSLQKVDCEADIYNIKEAGESYILIFILFIYRKDTFNVDC